jgi:hypothetical protein
LPQPVQSTVKKWASEARCGAIRYRRGNFCRWDSLTNRTRHRGRPTFQLVKLKCPIQALPQILIANWHEIAKSFPLPLALAPLAEAAADSTTHIAARGNQRYVRGFIKGLEAPNHSKQLQPIRRCAWFQIIGCQVRISADCLQHEPPVRPRAIATVGLSKKHVVRTRGVHRSVGSEGAWSPVIDQCLAGPASDASRPDTVTRTYLAIGNC